MSAVPHSPHHHESLDVCLHLIIVTVGEELQ